MSRAMRRNVTGRNPCMVRGEGIYLFDSEGKRYIDGASGSALVCNIGHGVREVASVLSEQAGVLAYNPFHCSRSEAYERMAETLLGMAPAGFGTVFSVSSGSEAVENAVKFARQHHGDDAVEFVYRAECLDARVILVDAHATAEAGDETADEAAEQRMHRFLDGIFRNVMAAEQKLKEKLLASRLEPKGFEIPLRNMRAEADLFRESNLALLAGQFPAADVLVQVDELVPVFDGDFDGLARIRRNQRPPPRR